VLAEIDTAIPNQIASPIAWQPYPPAPFERTSPRQVYLAGRQWLSPQLIRIWLAGTSPELPNAQDSLADFPAQALGCHIKLLLKRPEQARLVLPHWSADGARWPDADLRPISRTLTLADWDATKLQVAIDIAAHGKLGPAGEFARFAPLHTAVGLAGPGGPVIANLAAQQWWLFADLTGLPLVRSLLQLKPPNVHARAFVELSQQSQTLPQHSQTLPIASPHVHWCIRKGDAASSVCLLDQAEQLSDINLAQSWVVLACEHQQWQALYQHWILKRRLPLKNLYALPYWRERQTEEHFHEQRHRILDQIPPAHWHTAP
jgi:NADPH-dependent ferric siderophore reductase